MHTQREKTAFALGRMTASRVPALEALDNAAIHGIQNFLAQNEAVQNAFDASGAEFDFSGIANFHAIGDNNKAFHGTIALNALKQHLILAYLGSAGAKEAAENNAKNLQESLHGDHGQVLPENPLAGLVEHALKEMHKTLGQQREASFSR